MQTFHFQISGRIGDGSFTMSQSHGSVPEAIETAERLMAGSAIVAGATRLTVWAGEFGPAAECIAVYELRPTVHFERNTAVEKATRAMRTPR